MLKRVLKITGATLLGLVILGLIGLHLIDFSHSPEEIDAAYAQAGYASVPFEVAIDGRVIRGTCAGDPEKPAIIFVHGSPGTWDNFLDLMTDPGLLAGAQLIAFDRPGFGESRTGGVEPSLSKQAALVAAVINRFSPNKPAILVGHSYGGPVIAQTAVDFPAKVAALVIIAGSLDPDLEEKFWFNHVAEWRLVNWAIPTDLVTSNREILALKQELTTLEPRLAEVGLPVVLVHGRKDALVPYANMDYMKRAFRNAQITLVTDPDWGHFIPWEHPKAVRDALLDLLEARE
ncbi:MAG: alpha/beta hydrolase [Opitutaceae bacterium]